MNTQTESKSPAGQDPVIAMLEEASLPLTRENYLAMAYPTGIVDEDGNEMDPKEQLPAELETQLPEEIRLA